MIVKTQSKDWERVALSVDPDLVMIASPVGQHLRRVVYVDGTESWV